MVVPTQTQRLKLVLLPAMDGTGELFSGFVAALGAGLDIVGQFGIGSRSAALIFLYNQHQ
jgi:hypothetical protein